MNYDEEKYEEDCKQQLQDISDDMRNMKTTGVVKKMVPRQVPFKVGQMCSTVYTEDSLRYNADITSIIDENNCIVTFHDYGNIQKVEKSKILPIMSEEEADLDSFMRNAKKARILPPECIDVPVMCCENSAMQSMLMSWYLCGYQTGYWRGKFKKDEE